jgi:hypothetical protein
VGGRAGGDERTRGGRDRYGSQEERRIPMPSRSSRHDTGWSARSGNDRSGRGGIR